ncbi:hypothetical protein ACJRO7_033888 [Eucalyptus globulus]|uniref:LIM zinc-binding domain-containing protein n=1 Tax=Eucalyptus globulus TaxID=34317 RepID=A0ABD3J1E9_EUCGL
MGWLSKILGGSSHRKKTHNFEDELADQEREDIDYAIVLSLSEDDLKGKKLVEADEDGHSEEEPPTYVESEDDEQIGQEEYELVEAPNMEEKHIESQLEEDQQLAKALQESLSVESPPRYESGNIICAGCNAKIGSGRYLNCMDSFWHPECFRCHACNHPFADAEFSVRENRPYHKSCFKEQHHPRCDVCSSYIPPYADGHIKYRAHPFWQRKYCPSHERDKTPQCCSCERLEPRDPKYLSLDDGRKLCLDCLDSAIMGTAECHQLYHEIQEFYEGLNMKVEQQIPLLLVERQALNEAREGEKSGNHHMPETRGLCLSEEQCVTTIIKRPIIGPGFVFGMRTEPCRLVRKCEVTAILILYGLPRYVLYLAKLHFRLFTSELLFCMAERFQNSGC